MCTVCVDAHARSTYAHTHIVHILFLLLFHQRNSVILFHPSARPSESELPALKRHGVSESALPPGSGCTRTHVRVRTSGRPYARAVVRSVLIAGHESEPVRGPARPGPARPGPAPVVFDAVGGPVGEGVTRSLGLSSPSCPGKPGVEMAAMVEIRSNPHLVVMAFGGNGGNGAVMGL